MLAPRQAQALNTYQSVQVQSQSPLELIVMLYDGALRFAREARGAIAAGNAAAKRQATSRALAIVTELQNTLNMDAGGDVARSLDGLYAYIAKLIVEGNIRNDAARFDEVVRLLTPLREAWGEIAVPGRPPQGP